MKYSEYLDKLLQISSCGCKTTEEYRVILESTHDNILRYGVVDKICSILIAVVNHDFQAVVEGYNGSISKLANDLQIPISSFYNWVQGTRQPPQYLLQLVGYTLIQQLIDEDE